MFHKFLLFLGKRSEELDLLLIRRPPLVVDFERALQVLLHLHVEGLRLHVDKRRVVHAWNRLRRHQVMQVASKLGELRARSLLLPLLLLDGHLALIVLEFAADLLVLERDVRPIVTLCWTWLR